MDCPTSIKELPQRPVVVVTDRYPPEARGGAELSLHIALRAMACVDDVLVVTYSDEAHKGRHYVIDGVSVFALPAPAPWPRHHLPVSSLGAVSPAIRGARDAQLTAAELLVQQAHDVRIAGGAPRDFVEYTDDNYGVRVLRAVLEQVSPKLVHADNYRSILRVGRAAEGLDVRTVGVVRDNRFHCPRHDQSVLVNDTLCSSCALECASIDAPDAISLQRDLLTRSRDFRVARLRGMDRVVTTSEYLEGAVAPIVGKERMRRIPVAPEAPEFVAACVRGVAELPGMNLLVVGMINENKGQLALVQRLDRLSLAVPDVRVHLAGRGERLMRSIRKHVNSLDLSERVIERGFLGREELFAAYRECQIVVLPTMWAEGFGRVPLEAAMCRRPVVSFASGGLRETIVDGETGFLVEHGDFDALLARVAQLAADPALRYRMGEAAYAHVASTYNVERMSREISALWSELL